MNNEEIKALLRELKARSDAEGEVKSQTVSIRLGEESSGGKKKTPRKRFRKKTAKTVFSLKNQNPEAVKAEDGERNLQAEEARKEEARKEEARKEEARKEEARKEEARKEEAQTEEAQTGKSEKELEKQPRKKRNIRKPGAIRFAVQDFFEDLKARGIGGKELLMLGCGVLLVIFIAAVIGSALFTADKSVNVTAEDGLIVTVEREPESWCAGGEVELAVRTAKPIQSITVNGENCEFEAGKRRIVLKLEADSQQLDMMVVSEEGVYHAQVELPKIDTELPQISVRQENGQVELLAADSRSGLGGVYYGTADGFSQVPLYQEYTEPFSYESGKIYYYYAEDLAGNRTVPIATNMEPAQEIIFDETEITLFPEESTRLSVSPSPALAFCNNLQLTNQNPDVVSLDSNGTVTALQEGEAVIEASADGLAAAVCTIKVRSYTELTVSALGDCTLGTDENFNTATNFNAYYTMYGSSYFFQNVRSVLEQDDVTFANLEGTLTTLDTRENKQYAFKGDPAYTKILQDGSIDTVTLANNHSSDYGAQSLTDTQQYLTESGIDYCIGDTIVVKEVNGIKIGLIGIYVLDEGAGKASQVQQTIEEARNQGAQVVVVGFHWGSELSESPDETQRMLAHLAVDSGADLVVGHHPHVLQGIELYQEKYIAYSLGNFCFGGNSAPSDMDTIIFRQTFQVGRDGSVETGVVQIIPCRVSSQEGWNDYCPVLASGTEGQRIIDKLNERSAEFGQSYEIASDVFS